MVVNEEVECCAYRAQNNGRSKDNVRPDWGFERSKVRLAGHVDRTRPQ